MQVLDEVGEMSGMELGSGWSAGCRQKEIFGARSSDMMASRPIERKGAHAQGEHEHRQVDADPQSGVPAR